jgi:hypothetical protein
MSAAVTARMPGQSDLEAASARLGSRGHALSLRVCGHREAIHRRNLRSPR